MIERFPTALRFATAAYPDTDRVEAWRELFGHTICGLDIEPLPDKPFQSATTLRALPGLGVASGVSSGAHYWRPAHRIVNDDLVFVINHEGNDLARMSGREETLSSGQAILFAADRVGGTTNAGLSRFTTLACPVPLSREPTTRCSGRYLPATKLCNCFAATSVSWPMRALWQPGSSNTRSFPISTT